MGTRMKNSRIYWRERGGTQRAYADLRDYADVGGGREALIAPSEKVATSDEAIAQVLLVRRLQELDSRRRGRTLHGIERTISLADFAKEHLDAKRDAGTSTTRWLKSSKLFLERAIEYFGKDRELSTIGVREVREWTVALQAEGLSGGTVRHHINTLSNLYRRAQAERCVTPGYNPVQALLEKPNAKREEARWLEVHEASLFLEAARTYRPRRGDLAVPFAYELLATFLLTGGRRSEILCLEVDDVSFDHHTVTFRPNAWRSKLGLREGMKTDTSWRSVPLWPQLEEVLRPYVFGTRPPARLLFPSFRTREEAVLTDVRKLIEAVAMRAGWKADEVTSKMFRHTYAAARLQTLDQGAPVSVYTVARELGHGGETMVRRVYGHLGQVRHRAEVVEYRVSEFLQREIHDGQTVEAFLRTLDASP